MPPRLTPGDVAGRLSIVALYAWLADAFLRDFAVTGRPTNLVLLASGTLIAWFAVTRRPATHVATSLGARTIALIGTLAPLGFRPAPVEAIPSAVSLAGCLIGAAMGIVAIAYLGRNFGIVAAHRGLSVRGPYRVLRHPLYASYGVIHLFFVLGNVSIWNVVLLVIAEGAQMIRTVYEERVLASDERYRRYRQQVRWRIIPGVF